MGLSSTPTNTSLQSECNLGAVLLLPQRNAKNSSREPWHESSYFLLSGKRSERAACRVEAVRLAMGATKTPDCRYGLMQAASDRHGSCHMPQSSKK